MLLILCTISIAQVTGRGGIVSPGHCFSKGVSTKSEASYAAHKSTDKLTRKADRHVFGFPLAFLGLSTKIP